MSGDMLPSIASSGSLRVTMSLRYASPPISPKTCTGPRTGAPRPKPHAMPLATSMPAGSERKAKPPKPAISTLPAALLTTRSTSPFIWPLVVPVSSSPVGSSTKPRSANATGAWRSSDSRLIFTPTATSPNWLPLNACLTVG